jgi:hypothetical protein
VSCPQCIAEAGLAALRALAEGRDAELPGASFRLHGRPLEPACLAGVAEGLLELVARAGAPCGRHVGEGPERRVSLAAGGDARKILDGLREVLADARTVLGGMRQALDDGARRPLEHHSAR